MSNPNYRREYAHAKDCPMEACVRFMSLAKMYQQRQDAGTLGLLAAAAKDVCHE